MAGAGGQGRWKVSPSMRCQNPIKVSWAGRWGWLLSMGYQLSGGLGRASARGGDGSRDGRLATYHGDCIR